MSLRVFLVILFIICQYYYQCCVQRRIQDTTSHLGYHSHNIERREPAGRQIVGNLYDRKQYLNQTSSSSVSQRSCQRCSLIADSEMGRLMKVKLRYFSGVLWWCHHWPRHVTTWHLAHIVRPHGYFTPPLINTSQSASPAL